MHPFSAATAPSLVLLLLLLFSLSTTQYSVADANYNEISPISTDSHINQVIFDPDHHNSSLPLLIRNNKKEDEGKTYEFNITAAGKFKYFMTLLVLKDNDVVKAAGTPDTGSDLIWLNLTCKTTTATDACTEIKEPKTTFKCQSHECQAMRRDIGMKEQDDNKCIESTDHKKVCGYEIRYKDKSDYKGYFGKGRFRFGDSDHDDREIEYGVSTVQKKKISKGVVGLGRGELSLFQQLNNSARVEFKFSYCLPQHEEKDHSNKNALARSKLVFGSQVNTNPDNSTPLLDEHATVDGYCGTRYCIKLTSIYVKGRDKEKPEGEKITVKETGTTEVMIIDSGSTFTSLRGQLFTNFLKHVKQEIGDGVKPENSCGYEHCFEEGSAKKLEKVSLGFEGTTVELKRENIFDHIVKKGEGEEKKDYLCLTVKKLDEGKMNGYVVPNVHILGSRAQMDFKVAFDVPKREVSFVKVETCNQEKKNSNDGVDHRIESSNVV